MSRVAHPAGPRHGDVLPADHPPAAPEDLNELHEEIWPRGARRSGGVLTLGGVDVRDLAAEFGTPLYVCDEQDVRSRCREYLEAFGPDGRVFYAAKAFCSRAVLRWVSEEGLGVDVCTGGELEVALSAGVPPEQITMHGNNKTQDELARAVAAGVGHIVADSFEEIARLAYLTEDAPVRPKILVRVTTGVEAHTHEFMATAHDDQKFGFSLASGAADEAVGEVLAADDLLDALRRVVDAASKVDSWPGRVNSGLAAFLHYVASEPALARTCIVEALSAGPAAVERYERSIQAFVPLFRMGRKVSPHGEELPGTLEETIIGGIFWIIYQRIIMGQAEQIEELLPELVEFSLTPYLGAEAAKRAASEQPSAASG